MFLFIYGASSNFHCDRVSSHSLSHGVSKCSTSKNILIWNYAPSNLILYVDRESSKQATVVELQDNQKLDLS